MKKSYVVTVVFLVTVVFGVFLVSCKPSLSKQSLNKGKAFAEKGDYDAAITEFTEAINLKPDYAAAYFARGNAYAEKCRALKATIEAKKPHGFVEELRALLAETSKNDDGDSVNDDIKLLRYYYDKAVADYEKVHASEAWFTLLNELDPYLE